MKPSQRVEINTFVQGLITEASPLNFTANASKDEQNFNLNRDGTRDRRLGFDLEANSQFLPSEVANSKVGQTAYNTYRWYAAAKSASVDFLVVQAGNILYILDNTKDSISGGGVLDTMRLLTLPTNVVFSFATVEGNLVIASGYEYIYTVSYDVTKKSFTLSSFKLYVRDLWGVEGEFLYEDNPTFRGGAPSDYLHYYNLYNQSWGITRRHQDGTLDDPVNMYWMQYLKMPSDSETVWPGLQYQSVGVNQVPWERVYPELYSEVLGSTTKAAKGYFVIDLLRRGQSRAERLSNNSFQYPELRLKSAPFKSDYTPGGAKIITEFAGRVFYAGFSADVIGGDKRSPNLSNYVVFSQLVKNVQDISKCYQEGDPTSRENNDVVDTDGGFVRISGAKEIVAMANLGSHLIIFGTNGVWSLTGGNNTGFSATDYKVTKVSTYGCVSPMSVVEDGSKVYYWGDAGIMVVGMNQMGDLEVNNITYATIQTLYENISPDSKAKVFGAYDIYSKKIRWLYKEGTVFTSDSVTKELILDLTIGAFYVSKIINPTNNDVEVMSMFVCPPYHVGTQFEQIITDTASVLVGSDIVGTDNTVRSTGVESLRYLVVDRSLISRFSIALYHDQTYRDWKSRDGVGVDAKAYLLTGTQTAGDSAVYKQIPYLIMHFRRTEAGVDSNGVPLKQSGCLLRSMWDWSDSSNSHKWSAMFQAYRYRQALLTTGSGDAYDNGFETIVTKNKLRGKGRAFSLYLETEPYKDCRILGWNLTLNGNALA